MHLRRAVAFVLTVAPLVALACGGGGDDASPPTGSELNAATCQFFDSCCREAGNANDVVACLQFMAYFSRTGDKAKADQCIDALKTAACGPLPRVCDQATAGSGKPGDTCTSASDCAFPDDATDAGCLYLNGASTGGCFVERMPVEGAPCSFGGGVAFERTACAEVFGYTCAMKGAETTTGTCEKIPGPGDPCTFGASCLGGRSCNGGECPPAPQVGDPCGDGCGALRCDAAGTCAKGLPDGSPCTGNECEGSCNASTKKCVGAAGLGTFCLTKP